MPDVRTQGSRRAHRYDGTPDTAAVFRRIAALPDGPERSVLRQEMVCAWMPMAVRLARRFRHRGETFEDLRQVAQLGLVKAVSRFDPGRGTAFPSFAIPTILGEMKRHFRDDLQGAPESFTALPVDALPVDLLPVDVPPVDVLPAGVLPADVGPGHRTDSDPSADPLGDPLGGTEPGVDRTAVDREALRPLLRALPEGDRQILYMRFFCEMTQARIGLQLGVSQMHVSRLITRIRARLRDQVTADTRAPRRRS